MGINIVLHLYFLSKSITLKFLFHTYSIKKSWKTNYYKYIKIMWNAGKKLSINKMKIQNKKFNQTCHSILQIIVLTQLTEDWLM